MSEHKTNFLLRLRKTMIVIFATMVDISTGMLLLF